MIETFIRSSRHSLKFTNALKRQQLSKLVANYQAMVSKYVNILWNLQESKKSFFGAEDYNKIRTVRTYDARLRQCASKQACSMVKAVLTRHKKRLYKLCQLQQTGKSTGYLQRRIDKTKLSKPSCSKINVELDPRFVNIKVTDNHFDLFVQIDEVGNKEVTRIPVKHTKTSKKWLVQGKLLNSIRLSKDAITLYYEIEKVDSTGSKVIGVDQGQLTVASTSSQQTTKDSHGWDLDKIQDRLARRKKGSYGFRRSQSHRKNHINWSINQLNFSNVKVIRFEKLRNVRKGKNVSRKLSHWTYTLIKDKFVRLSEEKGFFFLENENRFMSQRCSQCGFTHKANRLGKTFKCQHCNHWTDSDLNAAANHELELCELPDWVWRQRINRTTGFYWLSDGCTIVGHECIVRDVSKPF